MKNRKLLTDVMRKTAALTWRDRGKHSGWGGMAGWPDGGIEPKMVAGYVTLLKKPNGPSIYRKNFV